MENKLNKLSYIHTNYQIRKVPFRLLKSLRLLSQLDEEVVNPVSGCNVICIEIITLGFAGMVKGALLLWTPPVFDDLSTHMRPF